MANYLYKPITEMPGNSGKSASASGMTRFAINKRQRIRKDGDGGTPPTTPTPKPIAPSKPSTGSMRAAAEGQLRNQPAPTLKQQVQQLFPQGNLIQAPQRQATRQAQNNYLQANATPTPASQTYNPRVWNTDTQSSPGMQTIKTPQNAWYNNLNNKAVQDSYVAMGFPAGGQAQMANQNGYLVGQVGNPMGNPPSAISLSQYKPGYGRLNGTYKSMKKSQGAKMSNVRKGYYNWGKIASTVMDAGSDAASEVRAVTRALRSPEVRSAVADAARGVVASTRQVRGTVGEAVRNRRVAQTPPIVEVLTEAPKKKRVRSSGKAGAPPPVTPTTPTGGIGSELGASDVDVGSFDRNARTRPQLYLSGLYGKLVGLPNERLAAYRGARATAAGKAGAEAKELQRKLVQDALVQRRAARAWEAKRIGHETDRIAALTAAAKTGAEAAESAARFYPKARNALALAGAIGGTALGAKYYFGKRMNKGLRKGNSEGSKKMNGAALAAMLMNTGRGTAEGIRRGGYEAQSIGPREQTKLLNMLMQMKTLLVRDPENPNMYPSKKPSAPRSPMNAPNYGNSGGVSDPENPYFRAKTPARRSSNTGQGGMKKGINWAKFTSRALGGAADAVRDNASRANQAVGYYSFKPGPRPTHVRTTKNPRTGKSKYPAASLTNAQAGKISNLAGRAYNFGENTLARRSDELLDPRMASEFNNRANQAFMTALKGLGAWGTVSLAAGGAQELLNRKRRQEEQAPVSGAMKKSMLKNAGNMNPSALAAMLMATGRGTAGGMRNGGYEAQSIGPRMQDQRLRMLMQRGGIIRDPENEQYMPMPTRTMTPPRRPTTTPQTRIDPANPYFMPYATRTRMPTATPLPNTSKRMSKSISNIQQGSTKHVVGGYRGAMGKSFYKSAAARPTQATKNHRSSKFGI